MFRYSGAVISEAGNFRDNNEDNFVLFGSFKEDNLVLQTKCEKDCQESMAIAAVLDGAGGASYGEVASMIGAKGLSEAKKIANNDGIRRLLSTINDEVCLEVKRVGSRMGSTVAALFFCEDGVISANLGDSRCYLLRDGTLRLLSHDHSVAQTMIDRGEITEDKARQSEKWHIITQYLGKELNNTVIEPYLTGPIPVEEGDRFFLCSDGVSDSFSDIELQTIILNQLKDNNSLINIASEIVRLAYDAGSRDNATLMIIECQNDKECTERNEITVKA